MRFWITSFVVLFALAKLLEWLHSFEMPLPVFIAGGIFLAIASNYDKRSTFPFWPLTQPLDSSLEASLEAGDSNSLDLGIDLDLDLNLRSAPLSQTPTPTPEVQLPPFNN